MYATGENAESIESYDRAIDKSYETFFADIESLYADADRLKSSYEVIEK